MTTSNIKEILDRISNIRSAGVIERYGFNEFLELVKEIHERVSDDTWLEVGWEILEGLGLDEFYGCDYDILTALENIPLEADLIDIQSFFRHTLVETLLEQFDSNGTTVLLDVGKMVGTPADILIPRILELRKKEIEQISLPITRREFILFDVYMREIGQITESYYSVKLRDLWFTAYGCQVLTALGFGLQTDIDGLKKIETLLRKIGLTLKTEKCDECPSDNHFNMSDAMKSLLLKRANKNDRKSMN